VQLTEVYVLGVIITARAGRDRVQIGCARRLGLSPPDQAVTAVISPSR
jgi:hypothetical protein